MPRTATTSKLAPKPNVVEVGDRVRLEPRELPFVDQAHWWWYVTAVGAYGFDCRHIANDNSGHYDAYRNGVGTTRVHEHRKAQRRG